MYTLALSTTLIGMRENLIPTRIVNKNGMATTVHRKPPKNSGDTKSIPAVLSPPAPRQSLSPAARRDMEDYIGERVSVLNDGYHSNNVYESIIKKLVKGYSDKTVIAINDYFKEDLDNSQQIVNRKELVTQLSISQSPESTVVEYLAYRDLMIPVFPNVGFQIIDSLRQYDQLPTMDDYSEADASTKESVTALIRLTSLLYKSDSARSMYALLNFETDKTESKLLEMKDGVRLNNDDLVNLVLEHTDKVEDIAHVITEDNISDPALIRARITARTPSLRNGLL